jgi:hypothetical protein
MHFCMKLNIPWEWYRTFLAVMKEGSLSGAARMLAITQPTGRHVAALESALGLVLFITFSDWPAADGCRRRAAGPCASDGKHGQYD